MRWGQRGGRVWVAGFLAMVVVGMLWGCAKKSLEVGGEAALPTEEITGLPAPYELEGEVGAGETVEGLGEEGLRGEGLGGYEAETEKFGEEISEGRTHAPMFPIYFDFDRYNIRDDMKVHMEENARFLLDHPDIRTEIQGNCDERGTNEYNLALGEKRAKSAKAYLVNLGVSPERVDTVSFGEERPLDPGLDEGAWAKNRRDDFLILK